MWVTVQTLAKYSDQAYTHEIKSNYSFKKIILSFKTIGHRGEHLSILGNMLAKLNEFDGSPGTTLNSICR